MACPHGEHESYCVECLDGPPAKVEPSTIAGEVADTARYDGKCVRRGCAIARGDRIVFVNSGDLQGWACSKCAHVPSTPPTIAP